MMVSAEPKRERVASRGPFRLPRSVAGYALTFLPLLVMGTLILYPALLSVLNTLTVRDGTGGLRFSLADYNEFFATPLAVRNLLFSLRITLVTVVVLFGAGLPIALYLRFTVGRLSDAIQILALLPLFVPGIIAAYALIRFIGDNGWLERFLNLLFGYTGFTSPYLRPGGIVVGLAWEGISITVLILTAGLSQIPNALLETARDVGANRWQAFGRITLPLMKRSVLIVLTLNFLTVFGSFTIPYLLGPASPEMMGVYMRRTFYDANLPSRAQVQAVITFIISGLISLLYVRSVVIQKVTEDA